MTILDQFVTQFLFKVDRKALQGLQHRIERLRGKLNTLSGQFTRIGLFGAAGIAGIAKVAISTDSALKNLQARSGATTEQIKKFKAQAYKVGSRLPLDTSDIINAQTNFLALGRSMDETMTAIPHIAKAAVAASGGEVDKISRYVDTGLFAFGKGVGDTKGFLDMMMKAEATTAGALMNIGDGFKYSAVTAGEAGVNAEEYIAVLGMMAKSGRDIEQSSQGLGAFLTKLAVGMSGDGSKDALRGAEMIRKSFATLGISMGEVKQAWGSENKLEAVMKLIKKGAGGDSEKMIAALKALSGDSYIAPIIAVIKQLDIYGDKVKDIKDASKGLGEAERQLLLKLKGLSGAWIGLDAMWDTFMNMLADAAVSKSLENLMRSLSGVLNWLTAIDKDGNVVREGWLKTIGAIIKFVAAALVLGGVMKVLAVLLGGYSWLLKVFAHRTKIAAVVQRMWTAAMAGFALVMKGVNAVMRANPIGLLITLIAALVAVVILLWVNWEAVWAWMKGAMAWLLDLSPDWLKTITSGWWASVKWFVDKVVRVFTWMRDKIAGIWDAITPDFSFGNDAPARAGSGSRRGGVPGLSAPLAAPTAGAGATTNQTTNSRSFRLKVDNINVSAPGSDSKEIAQNIGQRLRDQTLGMVENSDNKIRN